MTPDRWSDDQLFEEAAQLTRAQIALRDNDPPPLPDAGAARARRIEAIKAEITACQAFIDDCDRQADDLKTTSCMGAAVPGQVRDYLAAMRAREVIRKGWLEAERDAKRGGL